jgi:GntR family transcriptional regulator, transcriptional repressor for pyruvate dehydrogenase complex
MPFVPLSKTRLFENIVRQIQEQIKAGDLKPGDKLPPERELAEMFNVSRNSLREALRTLEIMNCVQIKSGEGVFIKEIRIDELFEPIIDAISFDKQLLLDLLDVRELFEVETARRAALYGTEDDFRRIREAVELTEKEIKSKGIGLSGDSSFHYAIAAATHNRAFMMIFNLITEALMKNMEATLTIPGQPHRTLSDHKKIYEAIANRHADLAAHLMQEHIQKARKNMENNRDQEISSSDL